jgi:hypothetical protein
MSHIHWIVRGTGIPKDKDEVESVSRWVCKNRLWHTKSLCILPDVLAISVIKEITLPRRVIIIVNVIFSNLVNNNLIKWPIYIVRVIYVSIKTRVRTNPESVMGDSEVNHQKYRTRHISEVTGQLGVPTSLNSDPTHLLRFHFVCCVK